MRYIFGSDIGGTTVKLGLFDEEGNLLEKWEIPTNKENKGVSVPGVFADEINKKIEER
ncbi:MAG: hypothetical protein J6U42_02555 [Lachnospiraceae bacterium]|nr:hypothetical protein [Lachnospiraceae bacterium]